MKYIAILLFALAGCQNCEKCTHYINDQYGTYRVEGYTYCDKKTIETLETTFSDSTDYWVCE